MTDRYVIVDKDNIPLRDELETDGLVILNSENEAADCIEWLIQDYTKNAYRGLRIEIYNPEIHGYPEEKHVCHSCGKVATIYDIDPYMDELYPEEDNPEEWWCENCYQDSLDDI